MPDMALKRITMGWLIATRSGLGHFAAYQKQFNHGKTDLHCSCGQQRSNYTPPPAQVLANIERNCDAKGANGRLTLAKHCTVRRDPDVTGNRAVLVQAFHPFVTGMIRSVK